MLIEFAGTFFDPNDVSDISVSNGCIWINRHGGLRGVRVLCKPGDELRAARDCATDVNAANATAAG